MADEKPVIGVYGDASQYIIANIDDPDVLQPISEEIVIPPGFLGFMLDTGLLKVAKKR